MMLDDKQLGAIIARKLGIGKGRVLFEQREPDDLSDGWVNVYLVCYLPGLPASNVEAFVLFVAGLLQVLGDYSHASVTCYYGRGTFNIREDRPDDWGMIWPEREAA